MKNLISKLIPAVFLLSLPFIPAKAQGTDSDSTYNHFYEFSYKDEIYRDIEVNSKQDSSNINFIFEKHRDSVDTVFNEQEIINEMKEIEKITNYEEKIQKAEKLVDKASKYCFLRSKIREFFLIRNLFEKEYKGWNIFEKHEELGKAIEDGIKYLAYRGLEDVEHPIPKPDFLRDLQALTEQFQEGARGLENFDKAWKDLTGEEPISQYERDAIMEDARIASNKYFNSRGELSQEGEDYFERQIQQKIFRALEKTCEEEGYYSKKEVFMKELEAFPRVATHPLAIFLAEKYNHYTNMNSLLEYYNEIRIDKKELYEKSSEVDFKYENYEYLLRNRTNECKVCDAIINLIYSARYNDNWKPKSGLTKDFVKARYDKDGRKLYGFIADDVHDEYEKTEEAKLFHETVEIGETYAEKMVQWIKENVEEYEESMIKGYHNWKDNLK